MSTLVNPALVAAANPHGQTQSLTAQKANAKAYAAAMREAGAPSTTEAKAAPTTVTPAFAREAPFGAERPRFQRPGSMLDLKV